ncbi:sialate:O-sulfotransferase 2-like [Ptychodera flava]|uniref:sialate:O-sulfotransferase 2-like n=1 Tax=Ptychodera flava TaxID=63121 RepID=UPI00396A856B
MSKIKIKYSLIWICISCIMVLMILHLIVQQTKFGIPFVQGYHCDVHFAAPHSLPKVALLSFPGSGNTWARHLLELVSGIYTGSASHKKLLYEAGFLGQMDNGDSGRVIAVKTHRYQPNMSQRYHAIIFLIRNPYGAISAEYNRQHSGKTSFEPWSEEMVGREEFAVSIRTLLKSWSTLALKTLSNYTERPLLVVHYEDLVDHTAEQMHTILRFLNVTVKEDRFLCLKMSSEGEFHRDMPTDERRRQHDILKSLGLDFERRIKYASSLLIARGFPPVHPF